MFIKNKIRQIAFFFILLAFAVIIGCGETVKDAGEVKKGVIDLRGWDFEKDGFVKLNGEWEYYHNKKLFEGDFSKTLNPDFLWVPVILDDHMLGNSEDNYGTFRIRILLDKPVDNLSLEFGQLLSLYRVFVNGKEIDLIDTAGKLHKGRRVVLTKWLGDISAESSEISVIIHSVYPSEIARNGITLPIYIGVKHKLLTVIKKQSAGDMIITAILIIICLYSLAFFVLLKQDRMPLYFAVFCLAMCSRSLLSASKIVYLAGDFPLVFLEKTLIIGIYIAFPFLCMYIKSIFEEEFSILVVRIAQWLGAICTLIMLFFPLRIGAMTVLPFEIIGISILFYMFYALVKAKKNQKDGADIVLLSYLVLLAASINEVLMERGIIHTHYYLPYAMFYFIMAQAVLIAKKYASAFKVIEDQSHELEASNISLTQEIGERTRAEKGLSDSEKKYRTILDTIREGYYELDLSGRLVFFNDAMKSLLGYPHEELVNMYYKDYMDSDIVEDARDAFGWVYKTGMPFTAFDWVFTRKDGGKRWIEASIALKKDDRDEPVGFFGMCRDITLRKKKEQAEKEMGIAKKANEKVMGSIHYAKMIQTSILPDMEAMEQELDDFFMIWRPKDIVSGDFYFFEKLTDGFIIAICDCTGHGVPGAFMTMIANSGLKRIIGSEGESEPAVILRRLNLLVKTTLGQDKQAGSDDGLDAAVIRVDTKNRKLHFAGANRPLFVLDQDGCTITKGDRQSIGYKSSNPDFEFTTHSLELGPETSCYIFSDGFLDQLGGPRQMMFGRSRLVALLEDIWQLSHREQKILIEKEFEKHQGDNEIQDDITFFGFRIKD